MGHHLWIKPKFMIPGGSSLEKSSLMWQVVNLSLGTSQRIYLRIDRPNMKKRKIKK